MSPHGDAEMGATTGGRVVTSDTAEATRTRAAQKNWVLSPEAFGKLLGALDADREQAGEKYEQIRGGLLSFFEWRGAPFPEDHADETLNRVAHKIDRGEQIDDPFTYVYGVARMLLREIFKARERERAALLNPPPQVSPPGDDEQRESELRLECLKRCLSSLPPEHREFITQYYRGERRIKIENRNKLAENLQIPLNALRLRARRLRGKLEGCIVECVAANRAG